MWLDAFVLLVKSFQPLGGDPQSSLHWHHQNPDQPWHFEANLKQCTFVLSQPWWWWLPASLEQCSFVTVLEHSSTLSEATRIVALSVKCLSLCITMVTIKTTPCVPASVFLMLTRSLAVVVDLISALPLIGNWLITISEGQVHNTWSEVNFCTKRSQRTIGLAVDIFRVYWMACVSAIECHLENRNGKGRSKSFPKSVNPPRGLCEIWENER